MAWGEKTPSLELCLLMDSELPASLLVNAALLWLLAQPPLLSLALRRAFHTVLFKHRAQATLSFSAAPTRAFLCALPAFRSPPCPSAPAELCVGQSQRGRAASTSCSTQFGVPTGLAYLRRNKSNKSDSCSFGRDRDSGSWSRLRRPRGLCQGGVSREYWELPVAAEKQPVTGGLLSRLFC